MIAISIYRIVQSISSLLDGANPNRRGHLLFAFGSVASFRLQLILARRLVRTGWSVAFLHWGSRNDTFAEAEGSAGTIARVAALADYDSSAPAGPMHWAHPHPWKLWLLRRITRRAKYERVRLFEGHHASALGRSAAALADLNPDVLIVSEDGISADLSFLTAARQRWIPIITVPYGYNMRRDIEIDLERKAAINDLPRAEGSDGTLLARWAPKWIKRGKLAGSTMFEPAYILAAEGMGITLGDPWLVHGGLAQHLCVESEIALARYRSEGIPARKMVLTGSPYCDEMMEALSVDAEAAAALRKPRQIESGRLRLLVSWFPSYHEQRGHLNEFETYDAMTLDVLGFLRDLPGLKLTVTLHPAVDAATRAMLQQHRIPVSDEYVIRLIPRHDLFMTYFSSTIRWALAAGKPVINYDAYRLGIDSFDAEGFVNVPEVSNLKHTIKELIAKPDKFRDLAARQCAVAELWGMLDGKCCDRIEDLIRQRAHRRWRSFIDDILVGAARVSSIIRALKA